MKIKRFKIDFNLYFQLVLVCQFSSAVVLVRTDAHRQHDPNLMIGDHCVTQYW